MLEKLGEHYVPKKAESELGNSASPPVDAAAGFTSDAAATLTFTQRDRLSLVTLTPPQTLGHPVAATAGCHALVIDVSFSMEASATVTSDDGDKVDHGFSILDIAKHATCTYIASLDDADYACVASYASDAKLVIGWTACDEVGKRKLFGAIRGLKEEGSTNLTGGLGIGFGMFEELPAAVAQRPESYAMLLAVVTDGLPSSGTHPRGGTSASPGEYASYVQEKAAAVAAMHGPAAAPNVVAIGLGNELDSALLKSFSSTFLHIPDPGSTGPCLVNLLAATRCTARLQRAADGTTCTANRAVLHLSPPEAVASVPGYDQAVRTSDAVLVPLGSLVYDQCRHVMVVTQSGAPPLAATVTVEGAAVASCTRPQPAADDDKAFDAEVERASAVCALDLQAQRLTMLAPSDDVAARLAREGARIGDVTVSLVWNDEADLDLHVFVPVAGDPTGEEISYRNKKSKRYDAVELDVDMNASASLRSKEPVENVYAGDAARGVKAPLGTYRVVVENFAYHGEGAANRPIAFKVQVRMDGDVSDYKGVVQGDKKSVTVCTFEYNGSSEASGEATRKRQEESRKRTSELERLRRVPENVLEQATALLAEGPLKKTLTDEALLAVRPEKHSTWGKHYLATLPQMLKLERRSNFRDLALQQFGRDAAGREAFFEELSSAAETCFAQLEPPKPSNIERNKRKAAATATAAATRRAAPSRVMPDEFMRGGGCFAPDALVACVDPQAGGRQALVRIDELRAGALVRTASGGTARVRCVVQSPSEDGVALLSELSTGLRITEWHPVRDMAGHWRFPIMLGRSVAFRCAYVYNLVLDREHVALIGGVPCVTLGHGIEGPVVGHAFYGTDEVLQELAARPGWEAGRVVLDGPLRAPATPTPAAAVMRA